WAEWSAAASSPDGRPSFRIASAAAAGRGEIRGRWCLLRDSSRGESGGRRPLSQSYRGFSIKKGRAARSRPLCGRKGVMDTKLSNRVVLVTGASGGLGGDVARAFVQEGARVVAHFSEHGGRAEALAHELGSACVPLGADLTLEAEVERLFAE